MAIKARLQTSLHAGILEVLAGTRSAHEQIQYIKQLTTLNLSTRNATSI